MHQRRCEMRPLLKFPAVFADRYLTAALTASEGSPSPELQTLRDEFNEMVAGLPGATAET